MTPDDFRAARKALGLTQKALAVELRMGRHGWQSISKWEGGDNPIPGPVTVALECLLRDGTKKAVANIRENAFISQGIAPK